MVSDGDANNSCTLDYNVNISWKEIEKLEYMNHVAKILRTGFAESCKR